MNDLLKEMTNGMQSIVIAKGQDLNSIPRKTQDGRLPMVEMRHSYRQMVDEVLYRNEVHDEFLIDCQP